MRRTVHGPRIAPIAAGVIFAGISFSGASAQVAAPDTTRPAAAPNAGNNWWDAPAPPAPANPAPQAGQQGSIFRHDPPASPYSLNISDYPAAQMGDWVMANAMAARARAMRTRAQSELGATIRRVQDRFEHSDEFTKAAIAEKQAYAEYVAVRQKALGSLSNDPKYHAIMQLCDELGEKIVALRSARAEDTDIDTWLNVRGFDRSKLSGDQMISLKALYESEQNKAAAVGADVYARGEVLAMATLKLQYASDARAIEVSALSADEDLKAARAKMMDASKHLTELRAQFDDSLHDNAEVLVARRNLEDARISVIEAQALAAGASMAGDYALNYAYYVHRNDNGGVNGPYGQGGNLAGYGSPYWGR